MAKAPGDVGSRNLHGEPSVLRQRIRLEEQAIWPRKANRPARTCRRRAGSLTARRRHDQRSRRRGARPAASVWATDIFAIGGKCTHYGGPLGEGVVSGETVRCPWHHACFSLSTGEAIRAPAFDPVPRWRVEVLGDRIVVREKFPKPPAETSPGAARRSLRHRGRRRCRLRGRGTAAPRRFRRRGDGPSLPTPSARWTDRTSPRISSRARPRRRGSSSKPGVSTSGGTSGWNSPRR